MNDLQLRNIDLLCYRAWSNPSNSVYNFSCTSEKSFIICEKELIIYDNNTKKIYKAPLEAQPISDIVDLHGRFLFIGDGRNFNFFDHTTNELKCHQYAIKHVAVSWSDDHNTVAVVCEDGSVMTYSFSDDAHCIGLVGTNKLSAVNPENKYINLGWGSEATQFKGKAKARQVTEEKHFNHTNYKDPPTMVWSQKSTMFAVNFYLEEEQIRTYKIFSSECKYLYEGSKIEGLLPLIAWKPPQSVLAFAIAEEDKYKICLYEKLGPIRDEFDLLYNVPVVKMQWSEDGKFLAVMQKNDIVSSVSIYMLKTGKWYLKQYIPFKNTNDLENFMFFNGNTDVVYPLYIFTRENLCKYEFKIGFNSTPLSTAAQDLTACAITDGKVVEISIFNENIVPPTMGQCRIELENPVNFVLFHSTTWKILLIDCCGTCHLYKFSSACSELETVFKLENSNQLLPLSSNPLIWRKDDYIECVHYMFEKNKQDRFEVINIYKLKEAATQENCTFGALISKNYIAGSSNTFELHRNLVIVKDVGDKKLYGQVFPDIPAKVEVFQIKDAFFVFGLLPNKDFYINENCISNHVSSFYIQNKYLHYINEANNELISIILTNRGIKELLKSEIDPKMKIGRPVEQGAVIVAGIPNSSKVILQMPRGNLETIQISIILIEIIERDICRGDWASAYDHIRMQKMNSNILIDLNVDRFLKNINKFLESVKTSTIVNQILGELSNECILMESYYQYCYENPPKTVTNKVQTVCIAFVNAIVHSGSFGDYVSSVVIACIIGKGKAGFVDAFQYISLLQYAQGDDNRVVKSIKSAIQYLTNHATDSELFKYSLGTYNLNLAKITANVVNIDPQEYKQFFQDLQEMNELNKRFKIADYLHKWPVALIYLLKMEEPIVDLYDYIHEHDLFETASEVLTPSNGEVYITALNVHAEKLLTQGHSDKAFALYIKIGENEKAYKLARNLNRWRLAVNLMNSLKLDKNSELLEFVEKLEKLEKYDEVAAIYEEYIKDYCKAFNALIKAQQFRNAYDLAQKHNLLDNIEKDLLPTIDQQITKLETTINDRAEEFNRQFERLMLVRCTKSMNVDETGEYHNEFEEGSLYAESSVDMSKGSRSSGISSRQRRKQERKVMSTKEGSKYEDIALLRSLHGLITTIFNIKSDVLEVVLVLIEYNKEKFFDKCKNIHDALLNLHLNVLDKLHNIWLKEIMDPKIPSTDPEVIAARTNLEFLDAAYITPPDINTTWKIEIFGS